MSLSSIASHLLRKWVSNHAFPKEKQICPNFLSFRINDQVQKNHFASTPPKDRLKRLNELFNQAKRSIDKENKARGQSIDQAIAAIQTIKASRTK